MDGLIETAREPAEKDDIVLRSQDYWPKAIPKNNANNLDVIACLASFNLGNAFHEVSRVLISIFDARDTLIRRSTGGLGRG